MNQNLSSSNYLTVRELKEFLKDIPDYYTVQFSPGEFDKDIKLLPSDVERNHRNSCIYIDITEALENGFEIGRCDLCDRRDCEDCDRVDDDGSDCYDYYPFNCRILKSWYDRLCDHEDCPHRKVKE